MKSYNSQQNRRKAFTLVELLVILGVIGLLCMLLLPAMRTTREGARRTECANRMRQLALAMHGYHDANKELPSVMDDHRLTELGYEVDRLSGMISLLPFMELKKQFQQITKDSIIDRRGYPAFGASVDNTAYPPWTMRIPDFRCPSTVDGESPFGQTNYAFCIGDMARDIYNPSSLRGAFAVKRNLRLDDVVDGTSQTILFGEIGTKSSNQVAGQVVLDQPSSILDCPELCKGDSILEGPREYSFNLTLTPHGRGFSWANGTAISSMFNTILPPGSPSCSIGDGEKFDGIYSAGSFHPAGVNVAFVDGSTHCINVNINAGDSSAATLTQQQIAQGGVCSPYGVWGAMGTIAGEDNAAYR